jgi:hypothetical protein
MEWVKSYFGMTPKPKTVTEKIVDLLPSTIGALGTINAVATTIPASGSVERSIVSPMTMIKGVPMLIVGYYTIPVLVTGWLWLPWIWVAYEIYTTTELIGKTYRCVRTTVGYVLPINDDQTPIKT